MSLKKQNIFPLILCIILAVYYFPVFAQAKTSTLTAAVNNQTMQVTIRCSLASGRQNADVTFVIYKPEDIDTEIPFEQVEQLLTDENGCVVYIEQLNPDSPSGIYRVIACADGENIETTFSFTNLSGINIINAAKTAAEVNNAIMQYVKILGIDLTYYSSLPNDAARLNVCSAVLSNKGGGYNDIMRLKQVFNSAVAMEYIANSKLPDDDAYSVVKLIDRFKDTLGVDIFGDKADNSDSDYDKLTPQAKQSFKELMAGKRFIDNQEFVEAYNNAIVVSFFKNSYWPQIMDYSKLQSSNILGFNMNSQYNALSDKSIPFKKIIEQKQSFKSADEITKVFNDAVAEAYDNQNRATGSESVSRSGGNGGNSISVDGGYIPVQTPAPAKNTENGDFFSDLDDVDWAKEAIMSLAKDKVLSGDGTGRFNPNLPVTREQFIKMIVKAFNLSGNKNGCGFNDVEDGAWYYESISIAVDLGIINGMGDGTFGIGKQITRQDMAVIAYRVLKLQNINIDESDDTPYYKDASSIADYSRESVAALSKAGVLSGIQDGIFAPDSNATRAQAAKVVYTLRKLVK